ncbi:hypothetical protein MTX26_27140 [Bradyrhizobium sp. ISRA443]|uniref:hypothetical protein n=1 Tax=unclassified Bradyrhizobium TaxID=2631580 RepID=UPI002478F4ED|nr:MULTISPECIES: hypothetical protein [unclassified Bradyrhizobium]WGR97974.1 hypothetical protein MTX23_27135 [Bradyrhizobium sp. ISRA436]WGS04864.1 hypothetical protein MTX18_27145 [Bradyrhizobium sp. ISRA437]WGS11745.1 hypothetical protein MTX26_27140 [Bradyrhizobium sp. ISRA443]
MDELTYILAAENWLYVAAVSELFSRLSTLSLTNSLDLSIGSGKVEDSLRLDGFNYPLVAHSESLCLLVRKLMTDSAVEPGVAERLIDKIEQSVGSIEIFVNSGGN